MYYYIVIANLSMYYLLALCGRAASVSGQPCKVTAFFLSGQIFRRKNFQSLEHSGNPACYGLQNLLPALRPDTRRRPFRSRKRVQNYDSF